MPNAFLISLFEFKCWLDKGLYDALRALPGERRVEILLPIFTLDHAHRVDRLFRARLDDAPAPYDTVISRTVPDLDELARQVADTDAWFLRYVREVSDAELAQSIAFNYVSDSDKGLMTRAQMLAHVITHNQAHRGGVAKMLEPLGIPVPSDMFTTYVSEGAASRSQEKS